MKKSIVFLIIGVICAIGALYAVKTYLDKERQDINEKAQQQLKAIQENQSSVMVAKTDIPPGTPISGENLEAVIVPNNYVQPNAASSLTRIDGMAALVPIARGEQITLNKLTSAQKMQPSASAPAPRGLASVTPPGKRAVTLNVDSLSTSVGMIKAGDYIDIYVLLPMPEQKSGEGSKQTIVSLFQNVLVLAIGKDLVQQGEQKESSESPYVTVALTPKEAYLLLFAQEQGRIRIVLRSTRDSLQEPVESTNWDTLLHYINPPSKLSQPTEAEANQANETAGGFVEIYRGMNKERMPLSR